MNPFTDTPISDAAWCSADDDGDRCDALLHACEKLERENDRIRKAGALLAATIKRINWIEGDNDTTVTLRNWQRAITQRKG